MSNKYRLTSSAFQRESEEEKVEPTRLIFLSMEGTDTEKEYIVGLNKYKKELHLNSSIYIKPLLRRKADGSSSPTQVIELLEEYLELRKDGIGKQIKDLLSQNYDDDIINNYVYEPSLLSHQLIREIDFTLEAFGYDLEYKKFLLENQNSNDIFGIVIDTDSWNDIDKIINYCKEKGYQIFISNPCFELWLLFHWLDVTTLSEDEQRQIKNNTKQSNKHTYVSLKLSKVAHHTKSNIAFRTKYLDKLDTAIINASKLETNLEKLSSNIGTNWPDLIRLLKEPLE